MLTLDEVRYLRCPECRTLMNRVNFSGRSGVIIDCCRGHGTWFDRNELQQIVEFIRGGGLEAARERDRAQLENQQRSRPVPATIEPIEPRRTWANPWLDGGDLIDVLLYLGGAIARLFMK